MSDCGDGQGQATGNKSTQEDVAPVNQVPIDAAANKDRTHQAAAPW